MPTPNTVHRQNYVERLARAKRAARSRRTAQEWANSKTVQGRLSKEQAAYLLALK